MIFWLIRKGNKVAEQADAVERSQRKQTVKRRKMKQGEYRPVAPPGLLQEVRCALDVADGVAKAACRLQAAAAAAADAIGAARKAAVDLSHWSNALADILQNVASYYDDMPVTNTQAGLTPNQDHQGDHGKQGAVLTCTPGDLHDMRTPAFPTWIPMQFNYHATCFYVRECFSLYHDWITTSLSSDECKYTTLSGTPGKSSLIYAGHHI